jgi:hypothetical protein
MKKAVAELLGEGAASLSGEKSPLHSLALNELTPVSDSYEKNPVVGYFVSSSAFA